MTLDHLRGRIVTTEFSSWTASLNFVSFYAHRMNQGYVYPAEKGTAYISMIDTEVLSQTNQIWHVCSLAHIFSRPEYKTYHWEYLAHGVVRGSGHKAVEFNQLVSLQLYHHILGWPKGQRGNSWYTAGLLLGYVWLLTK